MKKKNIKETNRKKLDCRLNHSIGIRVVKRFWFDAFAESMNSVALAQRIVDDWKRADRINTAKHNYHKKEWKGRWVYRKTNRQWFKSFANRDSVRVAAKWERKTKKCWTQWKSKFNVWCLKTDANKMKMNFIVCVLVARSVIMKSFRGIAHLLKMYTKTNKCKNRNGNLRCISNRLVLSTFSCRRMFFLPRNKRTIFSRNFKIKMRKNRKLLSVGNSLNFHVSKLMKENMATHEKKSPFSLLLLHCFLITQIG